LLHNPSIAFRAAFEMPSTQLFAIVLAAGTSSRFGATKQLQPWRGTALVRAAVRLAEHAGGERSLLVVAHQWREVVAACRPLSGFIAVNDAYRDGVGTSIRTGVQRVARVADGVLLLLADQPLVTRRHLDHLCACWRESPDAIVASRYAGTLGPPIVFPKRDFAALCVLTGDAGARSVVVGAGDRVIAVEFENAAVDIDCPGDLAALDAGSAE
jgi:molybdenum cofactor cytidylyltransferase